MPLAQAKADEFDALLLPGGVMNPDLGMTHIAVHTAGVGSWDADMREGWWPDGERPGFPLVLGTDGSGTIAAVGIALQSYDATPGVREFERLGRAIAAARLEVPIAASYLARPGGEGARAAGQGSRARQDRVTRA